MDARWPVLDLTIRSGSETSERAALGLHCMGILPSSTHLSSHLTAAPCSVVAQMVPYGNGMWKVASVFAWLGATWPPSSTSTGVRMARSWSVVERIHR